MKVKKLNDRWIPVTGAGAGIGVTLLLQAKRRDIPPNIDSVERRALPYGNVGGIPAYETVPGS